MGLQLGLEISGVASLNANQFWGNYISLWQRDSPNFFGTANHFWPIANHFSNGFAKTIFWLSSFLDKISPF